MLLNEETLKRHWQREVATGGVLVRVADWLGHLGMARSWGVLLAGIVVLALAAYGMEQNRVNDDPVKWFKASSQIRQASRKYLASLTMSLPTAVTAITGIP